MAVDKIIAAIPSMDAATRRKQRASAERACTNPKLSIDAQAILSALDRQEALEAETLSEKVQHLPMALRVVAAFTHAPMTDTELKVVQVLLDNPGSSSTVLSEKLGWGGQIWHKHFGTMCKDRETRLWPAEPAVVRDGNFFCGILADITDDNRWTMKPDVAEAFGSLGLRSPGRA